MATIILSAVGTAIGGPIGGSIGTLIGSQIDRMIFKPGGREGPRLKELQVTSSSYGTPIPRHFGRIRSAGTIIWSTDLVESKEKTGGGKGSPSVTSFNYSVSFAVAISSRPIKGLGRIWADGTLLRGEAGDLKIGGELRVYNGHGDQAADPLLASAIGPNCPAFRGTAYCVFESLQLAEFGNRIPALTFEVIADDGEVSLAQLLASGETSIAVDRPLPALVGYSDEGGPIAASLEVIDQVFPLSCDANGQQVTIRAADETPANPVVLPPAAADPEGSSFASVTGQSRRRQSDGRDVPEGMRYYDVSRDYQAGLQRADGRARSGRSRIIDFPGALDANAARNLANSAAERASWSSERLAWRLPELDPSLKPGMIVKVPDRSGLWRIDDWEWRENGVEVELVRLPHGAGRRQQGDPGTVLPQRDLAITETALIAFELPWDGAGSGAQRQAYAAVSSTSAGWTGAALFADKAGILEPLGGSGRNRSTIGTLASYLPTGDAALFDPAASFDVELLANDFVLSDASIQGLANGANRALVGEEIVQFAQAIRLSETRWRLQGLLRGRAGTEDVALADHPVGRPVVILDGSPLLLDALLLGSASTISAIGLADDEPVSATIIGQGRTLQPLTPVHPTAREEADGSLMLGWTRRARAAHEWKDLTDVPLVEGLERYIVGLGPSESPVLYWETTEPRLAISPAVHATLAAGHAGAALWVRQVGSNASSAPLRLFQIV